MNIIQASIYLFKVKDRKTRKYCEMFSQLTVTVPFLVDVEHISHLLHTVFKSETAH